MKRKLKRESSRKKKESQTHKYSLLTLSAVMIGLAILLVFTSEFPPITFTEAMESPNLREKYVQQMAKKYPPPKYVREIHYVTPEIQIILEEIHEYKDTGEDLMITNPIMNETPIEQIGKVTQYFRVTVLSLAFTGTTITKEEDFIASLRHEYNHTKLLNSESVGSFVWRRDLQFKEGPYKGLYNINLLHVLLELPGLQEQGINRTDVSKIYKASRKDAYGDYYFSIWDIGENMDPAVMYRLKVEFFQSWMWEFSGLFEEDSGKLFFIHPETKRKYLLPQEIPLSRD